MTKDQAIKELGRLILLCESKAVDAYSKNDIATGMVFDNRRGAFCQALAIVKQIEE